MTGKIARKSIAGKMISKGVSDTQKYIESILQLALQQKQCCIMYADTAINCFECQTSIFKSRPKSNVLFSASLNSIKLEHSLLQKNNKEHRRGSRQHWGHMPQRFCNKKRSTLFIFRKCPLSEGKFALEMSCPPPHYLDASYVPDKD